MKKKCTKDELKVCDFCIHFNMFKNKDGFNVDGSGYCGFKKEVVDAGDGCNDFYCKHQWEKNMRNLWRKQ